MTSQTARQAIRQAVLQILKGPEDGPAPTAAGRKVFASRATPVSMKVLPALLIYTRDERRDREISGGVLRRQLEVLVEVGAAGDDADDQVDAIAAQVEAALAGDPTLAGAVESIQWESTETDYDGEAAKPVAGARIKFAATYYTAPVEEAGDPLPSGVYASWAPDIGLPHVDDYVDLTQNQLPDVSPNDGT